MLRYKYTYMWSNHYVFLKVSVAQALTNIHVHNDSIFQSYSRYICHPLWRYARICVGSRKCYWFHLFCDCREYTVCASSNRQLASRSPVSTDLLQSFYDDSWSRRSFLWSSSQNRVNLWSLHLPSGQARWHRYSIYYRIPCLYYML